MLNISDALASLGVTAFALRGMPTNEAEFKVMFSILKGVDASGCAIESNDPNDFGVSWSEVVEELERLRKERDSLEYQRLRAAEYPPIADYLDGIVKDDKEQIQNYIASCLAVKQKYPKP